MSEITKQPPSSEAFNFMRNPIFVLITIWLASLLVLGMLQLAGFYVGFRVWPMGEDRVWLSMIYSHPGKKMIQAFWSINDRNPLSPWWWYIIQFPVKHYDNALYAVRKFIDPFLAVVTFLLIDRLSLKKHRSFAFSVALLVLLWNFSAYYEQIMWDFLGALGFSLLSIFFYCRYLDNNRQTGHDLAFALLCYFIAITTYTLQSGAIIAIACLAFFRGQSGQQLNKSRVLVTLRDTGFFVSLFILYNCIWYTASRNSDSFYVMHWNILTKQIVDSVSQFLYHPSFTALYKSAQNDWSPLLLWSLFASSFLAFTWILFNLPINKNTSAKTALPVGWVIAVLSSIALPIIILESTSQIWYPGSRSIMVQQVWQPLLYVSFVFIIAKCIFFLSAESRKKVTLLGVAALAAITFTLGLDYNHRLVLRTYYQHNLVNGIKHLGLNKTKPIHILVNMTQPDNVDINSLSMIIPQLGETMMKNKHRTLRVLTNFPIPALKPFWIVKFGPDTEGVINANPIGDIKPVPYSDLLIVYFDGAKVWLPEVLDKKDFAGLQIDWQRTKPINQVNVLASLH